MLRNLGLRLQILLLLGGLLLLAFLPLLLAMATYTQLTLRQVDEEHTEALARAVATQLLDARQLHALEQVQSRLDAQAARLGLLAALVHDPDGTPSVRFGSSDRIALLEHSRPGDAGHAQWSRQGAERVMAIRFHESDGAVELLFGSGNASLRGAPLVRMFGLYAFLIALAVIILAHLALTLLIVRPLDQLSHAAQSVMLGSRQLAVPPVASRELSELGESFKRMTNRLLHEEESLRRKVTEVEHATEELKKAQEQLVRSERLASVGRLAAGLAHEVGNPIAALIGLLDLVIAGGLEPHEQQDFLKRMRSETERVNRTLKDLLQFARPTKASPQDAAPGNVEAAVHDTATLVLHQASMHGVELSIDVYPGLPPVTLGREQLVQVLLNLLINAADALVGRGNIMVRAEPRPGGVGILVEDDGPGIAAEVAGQVFEPFFTTKEVGKGTGLGLSICQALVAAAGGSLGLDQSTARGARFVIWLPEAAPGEKV